LNEYFGCRFWFFQILDKYIKKKKKKKKRGFSASEFCATRWFGASVGGSGAVLCTGFVYWWLVCLVFGAFLSFGDLVLCVVCVVRGAVCFVWCGRCGAFSRSWIKKKKKKKEKKEIKSKEAKLSKCSHFFWYLRYFLKLMPISIHNWLIFSAHK